MHRVFSRQQDRHKSTPSRSFHTEPETGSHLLCWGEEDRQGQEGAVPVALMSRPCRGEQGSSSRGPADGHGRACPLPSAEASLAAQARGLERREYPGIGMSGGRQCQGQPAETWGRDSREGDCAVRVTVPCFRSAAHPHSQPRTGVHAALWA